MRLDRIKVRIELAKKDMTQKELSEKSGFSRVTVGKICSGSSCNLSTAKAIADALEVTVEDLQ